MSWRVSGTWEGIPSWVALTEIGKIDASPMFGEVLRDQLRQDNRIPATPTGPFYEITGPLDERGAFLVALWMLEDRTVTGEPPQFEPAQIPEDAES